MSPELMLRQDVPKQLVAQLGLGFSNCTSWELDRASRFPKDGGTLERFQVRANPYNGVVAVHKDHVDRHTHEHHVHGLARFNDQRVARWEIFMAKQSFHARDRRVRHLNMFGNGDILGAVADGHGETL